MMRKFFGESVMGYLRRYSCILIAVCLLAAGCSYRLGAPMQERSGTVAIPIFANKSLRPNLESCLTERLVGLYAASGGGRVVPLERADMELTGSVLSYNNGVVAYTGNDKSAMYQASMSVEATLRKRANGTVLWQGTVRAAQDYPANSDLNLQLNAEDAARSELCRKLAEDILRRSGEGF